MNYKKGLKCALAETTVTYDGIWGSSLNIGDHGGDFKAGDWFAPGDARNPYGWGQEARRKKKKIKKSRTYRRAFKESCEDPIILECVIKTTDGYIDFVKKFFAVNNIEYTLTEDNIICLTDTDEIIQSIVDSLHEVLTEDIFRNNILVLIGEMVSYQDSIKRPAKSNDEYSASAVRFGARIERAHIPSSKAATKIARQNIDQDSQHYDKMNKSPIVRSGWSDRMRSITQRVRPSKPQKMAV